MKLQHYYNSAGEWIAFRRTPDDRYLFDRKGSWVGWFPWNDNEAVDIDGTYLGTIVDGNRFYRRTKGKLDRPQPGFAVPPGPAGPIAHPGYAAYSGPPLGFEDAVLPRARTGMRSPAHHTPSRPKTKPRPQPTALQVWLTRIGLGTIADRIDQVFKPQKNRSLNRRGR